MAIAIVVAIGLLFDLIVGKWIEPLFAYFWGGTAITWFALILYIFVNIGYFVLVYRDRSTFTWTKAIIPALGVIFSVAVLYKSFLQALWNAGWVTIGRGIVVFAFVWTILGFGYAYLVRNRAKTPRIEAEVPLGEPGGGGLVLEPLEPGILGTQDTDPPPPEA